MPDRPCTNRHHHPPHYRDEPGQPTNGAWCPGVPLDRRREWAAALRWAADEAARPFDGIQDGDLDSTDLRDLARQIEAGATPWADGAKQATPRPESHAAAPEGRGTHPRTPDAHRAAEGARHITVHLTDPRLTTTVWHAVCDAAVEVAGDRVDVSAGTPCCTDGAPARQTADQHKHGTDGGPEVGASNSGPGWDAGHLEAIETLLDHGGHHDLIPDLRAVVEAAHNREEWAKDAGDLLVRGERYRRERDEARGQIQHEQDQTALAHAQLAEQQRELDRLWDEQDQVNAILDRHRVSTRGAQGVLDLAGRLVDAQEEVAAQRTTINMVASHSALRQDEADQARTEVERARPVIQAAGEWREGLRRIELPTDPWPEVARLVAAVDQHDQPNQEEHRG